MRASASMIIRFHRGGICFRNIHKFRPLIYNKNRYRLSCAPLCYQNSNYYSIQSYPYYSSQIRRITQKQPDPHHRVYRKARSPRYTAFWIERLMLGLCAAACLVPLGFMYYYYDGTVPITKRKRFLIIPLWLDDMLGVYTLQALGIGIEDDDNDNQDDKKEEKENEKEAKSVKYDENDPYKITEQKNKGSILPSTDPRVAHIEAIFENILISNYLKKCVNDIEYNKLAPSMFKPFHDFNWKINIVDKLSVINAMCVPGGKMIVFTGILKEVVSNDDECAAILSHEIGHALCRHGVEQMQFTLFLIACGYLTASLLGIDLTWIAEKLMLFGINILLKLPMSRRAELEADEIAIHLMKNSGYNLDALISVMSKLGNVEDRIGHLPEIMSTHPLTANRIKILKEKIENAKQQKEE